MAGIPTFYDEKDNIWSGAKRSSIYNYDTSVGKVIFNTMKNWPKNVCQISDIDGVQVTNGQGITWAIRIAQFFKKRGLNHKDVIGIAAKNTTYVMPLGVACLMNATPFHSVNPVLDETTIRHVFQITKPMLIFCDGHEYEKIHAATLAWHPEIYTLSDSIEGIPNIEHLLDPTTTEMFYTPEPLKTGGDQTMAILCSSGTTGMPKAVCISNSILIQDSMLVNSESVIFISSSLDWITGLWAFIFSTVFGCTRIITNKPFSPEYFVQLVKKYKINYAVVPPRHLSALITCPDATSEALAPIRMLNYGGGLVSMATLQRAQEICKGAMFNSGYGMTEVGAITINIGLSNTASAGKPIPGVKIRIVDEDGSNLPPNKVGEIYVHTNQAWNGYYGNSIETRRMQDFEGWFHTGDLGYFDDQNFLYIVDRKKEILKFQGLHYWPTEIENVITELPQVQDVCVVGIYDERHGDAAGALVVKRVDGGPISASEIVEHVAKRLNGVQKQLNAGVRFTDKLPANVNGKTMRKAARELFVAQTADSK
ncbi:4-coumarate--CoA ligase 1 [Scaptodrosophila lebanonensis]|uniref:4-coumarate--CoA ligase 1 n=1 Tax=Drosophila lebanonensis TaxID=7225 RepID=A0A6J2TIZ3_DROLE|nr:4-coumarate--CoA ligase 1 [Scaptodrosophila lebanonensis]